MTGVLVEQEREERIQRKHFWPTARKALQQWEPMLPNCKLKIERDFPDPLMLDRDDQNFSASCASLVETGLKSEENSAVETVHWFTRSVNWRKAWRRILAMRISKEGLMRF